MSLSLLNAIQAVKDKVAATASVASPEELAYLGTALERIGGRAGIYEIVEAGDAKITELADIATQLNTALTAESSEQLVAFVAAVDAKVAEMTSVSNQFVEDINSHSSTTLIATLSAIDTASQEAINSIKATRDAANISVTEAATALTSAAALAEQQAVSGSMQLQYYFSIVR